MRISQDSIEQVFRRASNVIGYASSAVAQDARVNTVITEIYYAFRSYAEFGKDLISILALDLTNAVLGARRASSQDIPKNFMKVLKLPLTFARIGSVNNRSELADALHRAVFNKTFLLAAITCVASPLIKSIGLGSSNPDDYFDDISFGVARGIVIAPLCSIIFEALLAKMEHREHIDFRLRGDAKKMFRRAAIVGAGASYGIDLTKYNNSRLGSLVASLVTGWLVHEAIITH